MNYCKFIRRYALEAVNTTSRFSLRHSFLVRSEAPTQFHSGCVLCYTKIEAFNEWFGRFKGNGVSEPRESIEIILSHVLDKEHGNHELSEQQQALLKRLCECRLARMPVQYIVGEWQFRRLNLSLSPPVFIPRPETETLVDIILERLSKKPGVVNVLEVGCGSGAISLALAQENPKYHGPLPMYSLIALCRIYRDHPETVRFYGRRGLGHLVEVAEEVFCTAVDQCDLACKVARKNSSLLNLNDRVNILWAKLTGDGEIIDCSSKCKLVDGFPEKVDLVVSNPPYVPSRDLFHLQPEILLYEDVKALNGGKDGLKVVLSLIKLASNVLKSSPVSDGEGLLFLEVDPSHPALLKKWLCDGENSKLQLNLKDVHLDLFGKERFVELVKM